MYITFSPSNSTFGKVVWPKEMKTATYKDGSIPKLTAALFAEAKSKTTTTTSKKQTKPPPQNQNQIIATTTKP